MSWLLLVLACSASATTTTFTFHGSKDGTTWASVKVTFDDTKPGLLMIGEDVVTVTEIDEDVGPEDIEIEDGPQACVVIGTVDSKEFSLKLRESATSSDSDESSIGLMMGLLLSSGDFESNEDESEFSGTQTPEESQEQDAETLEAFLNIDYIIDVDVSAPLSTSTSSESGSAPNDLVVVLDSSKVDDLDPPFDASELTNSINSWFKESGVKPLNIRIEFTSPKPKRKIPRATLRSRVPVPADSAQESILSETSSKAEHPHKRHHRPRRHPWNRPHQHDMEWDALGAQDTEDAHGSFASIDADTSSFTQTHTQWKFGMFGQQQGKPLMGGASLSQSNSDELGGTLGGILIGSKNQDKFKLYALTNYHVLEDDTDGPLYPLLQPCQPANAVWEEEKGFQACHKPGKTIAGCCHDADIGKQDWALVEINLDNRWNVYCGVWGQPVNGVAPAVAIAGPSSILPAAMKGKIVSKYGARTGFTLGLVDHVYGLTVGDVASSGQKFRVIGTMIPQFTDWTPTQEIGILPARFNPSTETDYWDDFRTEEFAKYVVDNTWRKRSSAVFHLKFIGGATTGSITLALGGASTGSINIATATAGSIQTALEGLLPIGNGNILVAAFVSGAGFSLTMQGALANKNIANPITVASKSNINAGNVVIDVIDNGSPNKRRYTMAEAEDVFDRLWAQNLIVGVFSSPGDSGSWIINSKKEVIGILNAGSFIESGSTSYYYQGRTWRGFRSVDYVYAIDDVLARANGAVPLNVKLQVCSTSTLPAAPSKCDWTKIKGKGKKAQGRCLWPYYCKISTKKGTNSRCKMRTF